MNLDRRREGEDKGKACLDKKFYHYKKMSKIKEDRYTLLCSYWYAFMDGKQQSLMDNSEFGE